MQGEPELRSLAARGYESNVRFCSFSNIPFIKWVIETEFKKLIGFFYRIASS